MKKILFYCLAYYLFCTAIIPIGAQADRGPNFLLLGNNNLADTVSAQNEFRIGVLAYYRFSYNEAINAFERANAFRPAEPLVLDWLGRAYYRSGFEDTAIRQWSFAAELTTSASDKILLGSRIETVRSRRSFLPFVEEGLRYVESGRYPGRIAANIYFRQPTSVLPLQDGTVWVAAYGSNELVRVDVNGLIRERNRGPINGFDRPYDIARAPNGNLYVSEHRGGRVSVLDERGRWLSYIGSRGIGEGQFVGPQNIAIDEDGYLYVVDYGNRRISKFDPDGAFLFSFGRRSFGFGGFLSPTGIASMDERIFIADNVSKQIHIFDRNGTYQGILLEGQLNGPESIRIIPSRGGTQKRLLVADSNRVLLIDPDSSIIRELGLIGGKSRITGAAIDSNGNIVAANFQGDEVTLMCSADDLASGFFVQIDRILADRYPQVTVELSVQDNRRRPVVGLDQRNFLLTERNRPVQQQEFLGAAYLNKTGDISVVLEKSDRTSLTRDDLAAALRDINDAGARLVSVISATEVPVKERFTRSQSTLAAAARSGTFTERWRFDTAIRLAASDLLAGEKKRAVVFVGSGLMGPLAFEQYSLSELAAYMANNGIAFYAIVLDGMAGDELVYLCEETGGEIAYLYQSTGVGPSIRSIAEKGSGSYALRFHSSLPTNFGRNLLALEAEVYLMERSGRDRIGYFAPLE